MVWWFNPVMALALGYVLIVGVHGDRSPWALAAAIWIAVSWVSAVLHGRAVRRLIAIIRFLEKKILEERNR